MYPTLQFRWQTETRMRMSDKKKNKGEEKEGKDARKRGREEERKERKKEEKEGREGRITIWVGSPRTPCCPQSPRPEVSLRSAVDAHSDTPPTDAKTLHRACISSLPGPRSTCGPFPPGPCAQRRVNVIGALVKLGRYSLALALLKRYMFITASVAILVQGGLSLGASGQGCP